MDCMDIVDAAGINRVVNLQKAAAHRLAAEIGGHCLDAVRDLDRGVPWVRRNYGALGFIVAVAHATTEVTRGSFAFHELVEDIYDQLDDGERDDPMIGGAICDLVHHAPFEGHQLLQLYENRHEDPLKEALRERIEELQEE